MSQQIAVFLLGISAFPVAKKIAAELGAEPVSYTHLTLPTKA